MVKLSELFKIFFRIGAFTFGGGYAMLSMVEQSIVDKRNYLKKDEFWNLITIVQALPGVFAINTALYVGYKLRGVRGAFFSALGASLPSFVIILLIAIFFREIRKVPLVEVIFKGIRPCVVALILVPAVRLIRSNCTIKTVWIPLIVATVICFFRVSPIVIIVVSIAMILLHSLISYYGIIKRRK